MAVPRSRLLDLMKVQCRIFNTTFNPEGVKTGNQVLRQRLKGPALADYYPKKIATPKDLKRAFPEYQVWDELQELWAEKIVLKRARGKGPPKKLTEAPVHTKKKRK